MEKYECVQCKHMVSFVFHKSSGGYSHIVPLDSPSMGLAHVGSLQLG